MDELEKIDVLRQRLGIGYQEAKAALDEKDGDLVQALIFLENKSKKWDGKLEDKAGEIVEYVRDIIKKGNVTKVRLKKGDKIIFEIPATVGAIGLGGAILSPLLAVLGIVGTAAAVINNYKLEIVRPDGEVEEHNLDFLAERKDDQEEK
mgnify:CR=1 FL=1